MYYKILVGWQLVSGFNVHNNSRQHQKFGSQKGVLTEQCNTCRWMKFCYGGCLKDRLNNHQNRHISAFCQSYQIFFEHANETLQIVARKLT